LWIYPPPPKKKKNCAVPTKTLPCWRGWYINSVRCVCIII
jgi:hypothetical protein